MSRYCYQRFTAIFSCGFENEFKIKNMGCSIRIPNGIISMVDVDFKCPKCECPHSEEDYYDRLYRSKHGLIYKQCKGCKTKLRITTDIRGDVRVWLKEDERKDGLIPSTLEAIEKIFKNY